MPMARRTGAGTSRLRPRSSAREPRPGAGRVPCRSRGRPRPRGQLRRAKRRRFAGVRLHARGGQGRWRACRGPFPGNLGGLEADGLRRITRRVFQADQAWPRLPGGPRSESPSHRKVRASRWIRARRAGPSSLRLTVSAAPCLRSAQYARAKIARLVAGFPQRMHVPLPPG